MGAGVALVEDVLELGVFSLDGGQGVVDALADIHLLGCGANRFPTRHLRQPEHVDLAVVVAVFQFSGQQFGIVVTQVVVIVFVG
ncbi:hypothetical protein D9M68_996670 [compost metagenome]